MQFRKLHVELRSNLDWIPAVAAEGEVAPATGERRPHRKTSPAAVLGSLKAFLFIYIFPSFPPVGAFYPFLFFSHGAGKPFDCWRFAPLSISLSPFAGPPPPPPFFQVHNLQMRFGGHSSCFGV